VHDSILASDGGGSSSDNNMNDDDGSVEQNEDNASKLVAHLAVIGMFFGALTSLPAGYISDSILGGNRRPLAYLSCLVLSLGNMLLPQMSNMHDLGLLCAMLGAANGSYLAMDTSLAVDCLQRGEHELLGEQQHNGDEEFLHDDESNDECNNGRGGDQGAARLLGAWGVFGFAGSALGPLVGGIILYLVGGGGCHTYTTTDDNNIEREGFGQIIEKERWQQNDGGGVDDGTTGAECRYYGIAGYGLVYALSATYFVFSAGALTFVGRHGDEGS